MNIIPHNHPTQTTPRGKDILEMEWYEENNKDCTQVLPMLPDHLKINPDNKKIAEWLLVENFNNWAYLELDIDIDLPTWQQEVENISDAFVGHPDQIFQMLYESCTLHGLSSKHTMHYTKYLDPLPDPIPSELEMNYTWTELCERCPTITNFWKNEFPIEQWLRVRFLKMKAGGYIGIHRDMTLEQGKMWNPLTMEFGVNMSITHPEGCETWFEGFGKVPWKPGKFFLHNISKIHWVKNFTAEERVHMIPMGIIGNRLDDFCDIVVRSYLRQTNQTL